MMNFASLLLAVSALAAENPVVVGPARFTVIAPECVRLEYQKDGRFVDDASLFAINRKARWDGFKVERSAGGIVIDTGRIRLRYAPDGRPFDEANLTADISDGSSSVHWKAGSCCAAGDLGATRDLDKSTGTETEEPSLLARGGYHVYDDSKGILYKGGWAAQRPAGAGLDWYLFGYGHDYKSALKAYTKIGGPVPLPRRYAMGSWYSRWWPYNADDYKRIVAEYHAHGFPLDVLVMDMDWHREGWTGYSWNKKLFPDPDGYLKWVHKQGLFATLNEHPDDGVQPTDDAYDQFMRALGRDPRAKQKIPFDAGDRRYLTAESELVRDPLERQGVDFWWLDYWNDEEQKYPLDDLGWVNEYYFRHSERKGLRGQSFSRWQQWGNHRTPMHFTGDTFALWSMLAYEVPFTANAGNVGDFFVTHDIGGYQGLPNGELVARWAQFGALSAALRLHSVKDPAMDKRPWTFGLDVEGSMRKSFALRSRLFPYIYSIAWRAHDESVPFMRPMYIDYPEDEEAYRNPQQYLFGDALLVAPVTSPGEGSRKLASQKYWLPAGLWYDWFSGDRIKGPLKGEAWATLDEIPLFARGGVPIPMQPFTERMTTMPLTTLIVRSYPGEVGKAGSFDLYEDDGQSGGYLKGERALTHLEYLKKDGTVTVTVGPADGRFLGEVEKRAVVFELPGERLERAEIDGKAVPVEYDAAENVSRVKAPASWIRYKKVMRAWVAAEK